MRRYCEKALMGTLLTKPAAKKAAGQAVLRKDKFSLRDHAQSYVSAVCLCSHSVLLKRTLFFLFLFLISPHYTGKLRFVWFASEKKTRRTAK